MAGGLAITSAQGTLTAEGGAGDVALTGSAWTSAIGATAPGFVLALNSRKVGTGTATVGLGSLMLFPGMGTLTARIYSDNELVGQEITGLTGLLFRQGAALLIWNANTEGDMQVAPATYRVYHALAPPNWDSVVDVGLVTSYQSGALAIAYTHYYAVSAKDTSGNESGKSNIVHTLPVMGFATMTWNANSEPDLAGYRLYHGTDGTTFPDIVPLGLVTTYQWTGLTVGITHYFKLSAVDASGNESLNNPTGSKAL